MRNEGNGGKSGIMENAGNVMCLLDMAEGCVTEEPETAESVIGDAWNSFGELLVRLGIFAWLRNDREDGPCARAFSSAEEAEDAMKEEIEELREDAENGRLTDDGKEAVCSDGRHFCFSWKRCYEK